MLNAFIRFKVSSSVFGYLLIGLGIILAVILPSTLVGLPGPGSYILANYQLIPYAPLVPLMGVTIGVATV